VFVPNTTGILTLFIGHDKYGQEVYAASGVKAACGIVKLEPIVQKTPIRSTGSASRGEADELVEPAMILFPANSPINVLSKFQILGATLRCISVQPRINIGGEVDHLECTFEAGSS